MQDFKGIKVAHIKKGIAAKKQSFDMQWLGRSLAYTPYQPRPLDLKRKDDIFSLYRLYADAPSDFLYNAKELEKDAKAFIVESLELVTYLRRYVRTPLIYDFLILDVYQLLEALVYGVDGIMLYPQYLTQPQLKALSDYALRLGIEGLFCIQSKEDLTKAIFAKAQILNLDENFSLIPLIPKGKIIIGSTPKEHAPLNVMTALDAKIIKK